MKSRFEQAIKRSGSSSVDINATPFMWTLKLRSSITIDSYFSELLKYNILARI